MEFSSGFAYRKTVSRGEKERDRDPVSRLSARRPSFSWWVNARVERKKGASDMLRGRVSAASTEPTGLTRVGRFVFAACS
jgi:hypothetical protein